MRSKNPRIILTPDPKNLRVHGQASKDSIGVALDEVGAFRGIGADGDNIIRAGNGVYEQALERGFKFKIVDIQPDEIVVSRRPDLKGKKAERAALWDNRAAEASEWDYAGLGDVAATERALLEGIFSEQEILATLRQKEMKALAAQTPEAQISKDKHDKKLREVHSRWGAQLGEVWSINDGQGLLWCGDSTQGETALAHFGEQPVAIFTSPPYAAQRQEFYGGPVADEYVEWFLVF